MTSSPVNTIQGCRVRRRVGESGLEGRTQVTGGWDRGVSLMSSSATTIQSCWLWQVKGSVGRATEGRRDKGTLRVVPIVTSSLPQSVVPYVPPFKVVEWGGVKVVGGGVYPLSCGVVHVQSIVTSSLASSVTWNTRFTGIGCKWAWGEEECISVLWSCYCSLG